MSFKPSERIFGLDIIRTIAIFLVVFLHSYPLISEQFKLPDGLSFPDGVDIFFVLSGFLIGRILLNSFNSEEQFNFSSLLHFLKRRWYRTLPNYYLFLIINIALIYFSLMPGQLNEYAGFYFVFMQNFYVPLDLMYWESWSLTIEEWFYPVYPILMVVLYRFGIMRDPKKLYLFVTFSLLAFPLIYRMATYLPENDWDLYYRKLVLTRLDTIGVGLLVAYFQTYRFDLFHKSRYWIFPLGVAMYCASGFLFNEFSYYFQCTFYFNLSAIGLGLLFPLLYSIKEEKIPFKPIRFLSLVSYSIYLTHFPIFHLTKSWYVGAGPYETLFYYLCYWAMVISSSYLIFRFFELPITRLRDR